MDTIAARRPASDEDDAKRAATFRTPKSIDSLVDDPTSEDEAPCGYVCSHSPNAAECAAAARRSSFGNDRNQRVSVCWEAGALASGDLLGASRDEG